MGENFDFDKWANDSNLSRESTTALKTLKLANYTCLINLKTEEMKRTGLSLGQEVLFRLALTKLGNPNMEHDGGNKGTGQVPGTPASPRTRPQDTGSLAAEAPETDPLMLAGQQLDALFKNSSDTQNAGDQLDSLLKNSLDTRNPIRSTPVEMPYDPRILLSAKASSKKAEKIVSFLPEKVKERIQRARKDRMVLTHSEDGSISLKSNDLETYHITVAEWGAANMRLMNFLLQQGDLARAHVEYYMAYTTQVFEYASTYEWTSILLFDTRYRDLQAEHGFLWGDMRLAQQMNILVPRNSANSQGNGKYRNPKTQKPQEECKKWLSSGGKCPFGDKCRYVHRSLDDSPTPDAKND